MKQIEDIAAYAAASQAMAELRKAEAAAIVEEARVASMLAQPRERQTALQAAARMLSGEKLQGVDEEAIARQLDEARKRLALLRAAIEEQSTVMADIKGGQSATVCADALPGHLAAAKGIVKALEGLRAAIVVEEGLRGGISGAGYVCLLENLSVPELSFDNPQSGPARLLFESQRYLEMHRLRSGGPVHVRLLVDAHPHGSAGDVVRVDGPVAAHLVRAGIAEATTAKVSRAVRPAANPGYSAVIDE